jgi:hypothetical protein
MKIFEKTSTATKLAVQVFDKKEEFIKQKQKPNPNQETDKSESWTNNPDRTPRESQVNAVRLVFTRQDHGGTRLL